MLKKIFNSTFNRIMVMFILVLLVCTFLQFFAENTRQALSAISLIVIVIAGMMVLG